MIRLRSSAIRSLIAAPMIGVVLFGSLMFSGCISPVSKDVINQKVVSKTISNSIGIQAGTANFVESLEGSSGVGTAVEEEQKRSSNLFGSVYKVEFGELVHNITCIDEVFWINTGDPYPCDSKFFRSFSMKIGAFDGGKELNGGFGLLGLSVRNLSSIGIGIYFGRSYFDFKLGDERRKISVWVGNGELYYSIPLDSGNYAPDWSFGVDYMKSNNAFSDSKISVDSLSVFARYTYTHQVDQR